MHRYLGFVACAAIGLSTASGWAQEEPDTSFEAEHQAAAELIVPGVLAQWRRDPMALDLLMRLPVPIRSAAANVVQSLRSEDESQSDACDAMLVYLLRHGETNIRARAASGLSSGKRELAVPVLVAALKDRDPSVRLMACQSLMFQKDGSASGAVAALLDDETSNVRHTAVRTLGWLGARDNLPDIRRLYRRETAAGTASWMFPDCFARLGDDELAIRSARPHLASENWNVRYFVVEALARVESKQVVPVLMAALPREMELELEFQPYFVPERTFLKICEVLDRRTGTEFGADAAARLRWWRENSAEYGVAAEDARLPEGFDELSRRFTEAARFAEAAAKRAAPREARGGSYCNLRITYGPVEAGERDEREAWSEPVNGLRARLFARPRYRTGENVQVLLMLECVGEEAAKIPGAVVDSYVPYVGADGPDVRILRDLQLVRTAAEQLSAGGMRMHAIDISAGRQLVERVEVLRILDAPARHSAVFVAPPRPGKYHFRAVFSPCGVAPDGIGDDSHARDYPEWKSKQLVTPPIVIEIVEQE